MNNIDYSNTEAIRDSINLVEKYSVEQCLIECHFLCNALDKDGDLEDVYRRKKNNACLNELWRLSFLYYGARNLLSALYYVAGDVEQYVSHLQQHKDTLEDLEDFLDTL